MKSSPQQLSISNQTNNETWHKNARDTSFSDLNALHLTASLIMAAIPLYRFELFVFLFHSHMYNENNAFSALICYSQHGADRCHGLS